MQPPFFFFNLPTSVSKEGALREISDTARWYALGLPSMSSVLYSGSLHRAEEILLYAGTLNRGPTSFRCSWSRRPEANSCELWPPFDNSQQLRTAEDGFAR